MSTGKKILAKFEQIMSQQQSRVDTVRTKVSSIKKEIANFNSTESFTFSTSNLNSMAQSTQKVDFLAYV